MPEPQNLISASALVRSRRVPLLLQSSWALTQIPLTAVYPRFSALGNLGVDYLHPPPLTRGEGDWGRSLTQSGFFVGSRCLVNLISDRILLSFDRIQSFWRFSICLDSDHNFCLTMTSNRHISFICRILEIRLIGNLTNWKSD